MAKKKPSWRGGYTVGQKVLFASVFLLILAVICSAFFLTGDEPEPEVIPVQETDEVTFGIDVAKFQGTIDWQKVSQSGVKFAMIRVGYRGMTSGEIQEDSNARYNLQEAAKYGIKLGVYFFSTAVSGPEAVQEANWVADYISQYPITYPVAYDCERFTEPESRQYGLTNAQRTDLALVFLRTIEELGYHGMFYGSRNDMQDNARWDMGRIAAEFKVWVAQYPLEPYPETAQSSYTGIHQMWQYASDGIVDGISQPVDLNIAYFGYDGTEVPQNPEPPAQAFPDPEALIVFREVSETVTAKDTVNLRSTPSQDADSHILGQLFNGDTARRVGISDSGWSKLEVNGHTCYAVSNLLTTDLHGEAQEDTDKIQTVFTPVREQVTAKDAVNLRTMPSVEHKDSQVVVKLKNGEVVTRTGINTDVGWSRVEYNGQILYCVSSYLKIVE